MAQPTDPTSPPGGYFGAYLRSARRKKGMSQVQLANALGMSQQSVTRWESGDVPPLATLARIGAALDVPLSALARFGDGDPVPLADRVRKLEEMVAAFDADLAALKGRTADPEVSALKDALAVIRAELDAIKSQMAFPAGPVMSQVPAAQQRQMLALALSFIDGAEALFSRPDDDNLRAVVERATTIQESGEHINRAEPPELFQGAALITLDDAVIFWSEMAGLPRDRCYEMLRGRLLTKAGTIEDDSADA